MDEKTSRFEGHSAIPDEDWLLFYAVLGPFFDKNDVNLRTTSQHNITPNLHNTIASQHNIIQNPHYYI